MPGQPLLYKCKLNRHSEQPHVQGLKQTNTLGNDYCNLENLQSWLELTFKHRRLVLL